METFWTILILVLAIWLVIGIIRAIFFHSNRLSFIEEILLWDLLGDLLSGIGSLIGALFEIGDGDHGSTDSWD